MFVPEVRKASCLEQPVKSVDWFGLKRARDHTSLPIAVDEGCFSTYDVARLARMEACDLVVLKVAKSGGPLGCQRSAVVAEANGLGLLGSGLRKAGLASRQRLTCSQRSTYCCRRNSTARSSSIT